MAYTAMTSVPDLTQIAFFQWSTPTFPNPTLATPISATDTTITFTAPAKDHSGAVITRAFLMGIKNSSGYTETVYVPAGALSVDGLTATGVVRGVRLEGLDWTTGDSTLAQAFNQDSPVYCNISGVLQAMNTAGLTAQISSKALWSARPTFTSTGLIADRVFADATARDAAITSPSNGDRCYNTATGTFQKYQGGAWTDDATGTTVNASETVAGKIELATNAEMGTCTSIGGTGARLVPPNDQLVKTSSGAVDENKIAVLNASGKFADGFINDLWINDSVVTAKGDIITATASSTPAVLAVGTNGKVLLADSTASTGQAWGYPSIGSITASDDLWLTIGGASTSSTSFIKMREAKVFNSGTIRCKLELKDNLGGSTAHARIYVNGVAVGADHTTTSSTYQPFSDDITIVSGDLVQLYMKDDNGGDTASVQNFGLYGTGLRNPVVTL